MRVKKFRSRSVCTQSATWEDWSLEVEKVMRESLRKILSDALEDYKMVCWSRCCRNALSIIILLIFCKHPRFLPTNSCCVCLCPCTEWVLYSCCLLAPSNWVGFDVAWSVGYCRMSNPLDSRSVRSSGKWRSQGICSKTALTGNFTKQFRSIIPSNFFRTHTIVF